MAILQLLEQLAIVLYSYIYMVTAVGDIWGVVDALRSAHKWCDDKVCGIYLVSIVVIYLVINVDGEWLSIALQMGNNQLCEQTEKIGSELACTVTSASCPT